MAEFPDDTAASINCFETTTNLPINITMDPHLLPNNSTLAKSPGKTSPINVGMGGSHNAIGGTGRTMKEYEDQMEILKKENFRLKLRIYILEERMCLNPSEDELIKKDLEIRCENETLKHDLAEKQELLSQAAKGYELIKEQIQDAERNRDQYLEAFELQKEKVEKLELELQELKENQNSPAYIEEVLGVSPDEIIELTEKLHKSEEIQLSLEAQLKQITASLEEERNWIKEIENERDSLKFRLEAEILARENYVIRRDQEFDNLKKKVQDLEEQLCIKENSLQQLKNDLIEKDKIIDEKCLVIDEKNKAYEEVTDIAEKRKKQIDQLRLSIKTREDALSDLNNKNRSLLTQFESTYRQRCASPRSPSVVTLDDTTLLKKTYDVCSPPRNYHSTVDLDAQDSERNKTSFDFQYEVNKKELENLKKELEEKESEIKKQEEAKRQLMLKYCNEKKSTSNLEQKLKKLEDDYKKAIKMIQGFMKRHEQIEAKNDKKDKKIMELEVEISKLQNEIAKQDRTITSTTSRRNLNNEFEDGPERDHNGQQRFEEIESKFNDLRDQIDTIMAEKCLLEKQTQIDSEKFYDRIQDKDLKIECLECERNSIRDELQDCKEEYNKLKESYEKLSAKLDVQESADIEKLKQELIVKAHQLDDKNQLIEKLDKELQLKTHNLQKLVNTELWSKNKEIAKLHNHMTNLDENSSTQLNILIKELNDIGIQVKFTDDLVQLNYVNADTPIDIITITDYIQKLIVQKNDLEKEINYLKWLKIETRSSDENTSNTERNRKYCELLRTHLKDLIKFMKEMLKNTDQTEVVCNDQKKIVLDVLANSKILSDDFINALEEMALNELEGKANVAETIKKNEKLMIKSKSENTENKSQNSTPSDSEAFSEPDRVVSFARIGLPETKQKSINRNRTNKENKILSDSEDSMEYEKNNKSYQNDLTDFDANRQLLELQEINNFLHSELTILRKEMLQSTVDREIDGKIALLLSKLEKSQRYCEKLQITVEKKIHECSILKKQSKQNTVQKLQLEKKMLDAENMALESEQQKAELIQCIENVNKQSSNLNKENEMLKFKIIKLEEESETVRDTVLQLTKELDLLGLKHSQTLVDCTKLTNEKLRLEHDLRKSESRYEVAVRKLQEKFHKEVTDLNQINESHRARVKELEEVNKELRRHVVICEASDSAPSSSGISSIQPDLDMKHPFNDIPEYHAYNGSHWLPLTYPASSATRSKSSCSPDLGIESDAALTSTRPLKNTLKITESMTNLLSDDDNCNNNPGIVDTDTETPLPIEGLDEVEVLKQENEALKRRLMKTRKALEDTFQHLSTSNKNKKNVEKAITKQLMITKSILKKTRTYEDPTYEN